MANPWSGRTPARHHRVLQRKLRNLGVPVVQAGVPALRQHTGPASPAPVVAEASATVREHIHAGETWNRCTTLPLWSATRDSPTTTLEEIGRISGMDPEEWEYGQALDQTLGQTTALLASRGDEHAVALLVDVRSIALANTDEVVRTELVDNLWTETRATQTFYRQEALLDVEDHLVARFTDEVCQRIAEVLSYVGERNGLHDIGYVRARVALPEIDEDWRTTYAARLTTDRPSNQARRERTLPNHPVEDGLTFTNSGELRVYQVLKRIQSRFHAEDTIAIAPLPGVHLYEGHTWTPDMLVLGHGRALIIEIDGPHHRSPRRNADDGNRDLQWRRCGVPVIRLPVEDLDDETALEARLLEEIRRQLPRC